MANVLPAPAWQAPQVRLRLAGFTVERGSEDRKDIVHAVARGAVCDALRTGARSQSMITVGECGNAIGGKVVARFESRVAVAAPASHE